MTYKISEHRTSQEKQYVNDIQLIIKGRMTSAREKLHIQFINNCSLCE